MGCEHRLPPGAFNLPPGCTLKDIEDNAGCDEPTCDSCGEECRDLSPEPFECWAVLLDNETFYTFPSLELADAFAFSRVIKPRIAHLREVEDAQ